MFSTWSSQGTVERIEMMREKRLVLSMCLDLLESTPLSTLVGYLPALSLNAMEELWSEEKCASIRRRVGIADLPIQKDKPREEIVRQMPETMASTPTAILSACFCLMRKHALPPIKKRPSRVTSLYYLDAKRGENRDGFPHQFGEHEAPAASQDESNGGG